MTIEISPQCIEKLDAAIASGVFTSRQDAVESLVLENLPDPVAPMTRPIRTQEEADAWVAELKEWVANRPGVDHFVDDSRESIYQGRGE